MAEAAPADTLVAESHALTPDQVARELGSDLTGGLGESDAASRLRRDGPNALPQAAGDPLIRRVLRQFHSPLVYVLLAAAATTLVLGEYVDSAVILGVVALNAVVGFVQESNALAALDSLRSMTHVEARVVRDGAVRAVASERLVTGDLVCLEAGEQVPADLRLVHATEVRVDESTLTGESVPVRKHDGPLATDARVADRSTMFYAGTLVSSGTARGLVVATGGGTELGSIHRMVGSASVLATPLTRKLAHFSAVLTGVIIALAVVAFAVGLLRGEAAPQMFTAAVALAVGAIPEGLPAAVTITLAIGVRRMVRRRAVVRRLPAVETLGGTTVICTDKTGTLTTNEMTVRAIWTPDGQVEVEGSGYDPAGRLAVDGVEVPTTDRAGLRWSLAAGSACNDSGVSHDGEQWVISGDPTEAAMKVVALKTDVAGVVDDHWRRVATAPFDSRRQWMATLHEHVGANDGTLDGAHDGPGDGPVDGDGRHLVLLKGATERVLALCDGWLRADGTHEPLDADRIAAVGEAVRALAGTGLRVLATAVALDPDPDAFSAEDLQAGRTGTLLLTGLQAMLDPPRPAAARAIAACHAAGIEVKMITGDHGTTAAAIAGHLGLEDRPGPRVVTGAELGELAARDAAGDTTAYAEAVAETRVFARVSPEEKLRLVQALQAQGHVVAMTGDGVNDAPALRQADIGIAMGRGGTEVAKEAADMVLVDDDFATIEAAVEEGRGVFDNLTKFIVWTLPTNMGEGLVILVAILFGTALPILPTQILWINMTTAVVLGLMLAFEPREPGIMSRPPRDPDRALLTPGLVWRTVLVAGLLVASSWWVFLAEQDRGASLEVARTAAVSVFVMVEIAYLFSCRSLTRPSWRLGLLSNPWLIAGVLVQILAQAAFTYLPVMNRVFGTAPLEASTWLRILGVTLVVSVAVGVDKAVAARRPSRSR